MIRDLVSAGSIPKISLLHVDDAFGSLELYNVLVQ